MKTDSDGYKETYSIMFAHEIPLETLELSTF